MRGANKADYIRGILFGKSIAKKLIREHSDSHMVFTFENVGDPCLELAYLRRFQQEHGYKRISVLTCNPTHPLYEYFVDQFDELIYVKEKDLLALLMFYKSDMGFSFRRKNNEITCAYYSAGIRSDVYLWNKYIRLDRIVKSIYGIPLDSKPCSIHKIDCSEYINDLIEKSVIIPSKTVILNPYATSCREVPLTFFEKIADELTNKGYKVLCSINGNQMATKNTETITYSLDKLVSIVEACGYLIGVRSGFMDLASYANAKIISIDHDNFSISDASKLEDLWPQNTNIRTIRYKENEEATVMDVLDSMQ